MERVSTYTESELFARVAEGDEAAFKELYTLLHPVLKGFIIKIIRSEEEVMEIIQESLIRLWLNRDKLAGIEHPRSWFFRIVTNECYRYFRKHGLQERLRSAVEQEAAPSTANTTELELSFRETQAIIRQAVQSLASRQREVYVLSRDGGLKIHEIAEKMGVTPGYVKKTLTVALRVIRQKLVEAGKFTISLFWILL